MAFDSVTGPRWGAKGGLTRSSKYDMREAATRASRGLQQRFYRQVDPNCVLDPEERARRAHAAYRAHMHGLAALSAESRERKAKARAAASESPTA